MSAKIQIIAEAGVNHNGSLARALEMIDVAAQAGADIIKFQSFRTEQLVTPDARKARYQAEATGGGQSQFEMLKALELSDGDHRTLMAKCAEVGIEFLSTPFDLPSLEMLAGYGLRRLKISSGEITNAPLLVAAAHTGCDIILSTGMSTEDEIHQALGALAFGYLAPQGRTPGRAVFAALAGSAEAAAALAEKVVLLHCTSAYPAPVDSVNLLAMDTMRRRFGLPVGYSDHTQGDTVSVAAAALGARVIEKHFTLDRNLPGPDHQASLDGDGLRAMVQAVRVVEAALGDGAKVPSAAEQDTKAVARKSLVALRPVTAGECFTQDNLGVKRPGGGVSPMDYFDWLGKTATRDFAVNEPVS